MKKNLVKLFAVLNISMLMLVPSKALTKEYNLEINKEYTNATVSVMLPDEEYSYEMKVISPDGKEEYESETVDGQLKCKITNPLKEGKWTVRVEKYKTGVDGNKVADVDPITGLDIVFKGNTEKTANVDDGVLVAADIVGFKYYMIDDNLIIGWDDDNCGNVNVEVVNEGNNKTIGKETVQGKATAFKIENDVTKVIIKAVPSVSANVNGAEKQYSFEIPAKPDVNVTFEELPIDGETPVSNKTELNYTVSANEDCSVRVLKDTQTLAEEKGIKAGEEKNFSVKIEEGTNELLFYTIDVNGNMFSTPYKVYRDTVAPILQFGADYDLIQTGMESLEFNGKVEDYTSFTCNGKDVKVEGDNTFGISYGLKEGLNEITFVAKDFAGNESIYTARVTRVVKDNSGLVVKIVAGVILVLLIGLYIYWIKKHPKQPHKEVKEEKAKNSKEEKKSLKFKPDKAFVKEIINLVIPVAVIIVLFRFLFCIGTVMSGSMEPTLRTGDTVIDNRLAYIGDREVLRGDIITFYSAEFDEVLGKRVIGLPGDEISFRDGYVVINGQYVDESDYISEDIETNCTKEFKVPANCYFLLGDNRENSNDSRYWANPYIPKEDIIGKYIASFPFSIERDILHILQ